MRKYKNVKNRPLPIDGIGSVGGRAIFCVEEREMTGEIQRLEGQGFIRLMSETKAEEKPEPVVEEKVEEEKETETTTAPDSTSESDSKDDEGSDTSLENDDESLTNSSEMVELERENDSVVSGASRGKKKAKSRKRTKK